MDSISRFLHRLGDAEYLHLLLEPLPLFGAFFGLLFFAFSLALKNRKLQMVALAVVAGSSLVYFPYLLQREAATPQMKAYYRGHPAVEKRTAERREERWIYYGAAALCLGGIVLRKGKLGPVFVVGSMAGGLAVVAVSALAHLRDAETFHPNVAQDPPTEVRLPINLKR